MAMDIRLACPRCGNTGWIRRGGDFECTACGEIAEDTKDMPPVIVDRDTGETVPLA